MKDDYGSSFLEGKTRAANIYIFFPGWFIQAEVEKWNHIICWVSLNPKVSIACHEKGQNKENTFFSKGFMTTREHMNPLLQNSNFSAWSISFSSSSPPHPEFPLNFLRQTLTQCNQMGELHRVTWDEILALWDVWGSENVPGLRGRTSGIVY